MKSFKKMTVRNEPLQEHSCETALPTLYALKNKGAVPLVAITTFYSIVPKKLIRKK